MTKTLKGLAALIVAGAATAALVACSPSETAPPQTPEEVAEDNGDSLWEATYELNDGRTVTCLGWTGYRKGGLSCDFAGAQP